MRRHFGRMVALAVLGLLVLAAAGLRTEWAGGQVCGAVRTRLPGLLGMEVGLGRCDIDLFRGGVEIRGFSITPPLSEEPLFAADRLLVRLGLVDLLAGRIRLERVEAERPRVRADLDKLDIGSSSGCFIDRLPRLEVESVAINGAEAHVVSGGRALDLDALDLDVRMSRHAWSIRLGVSRGRVGTGRVELPFSRLRASAAYDLDRRKLTVNQLDVAAGELSASVRGEIESPCDPSFNLEASVYLPLDLVAAILGPEAPKMSGAAVIGLRKVEGTLLAPTAEFEVSLARAKVADFDVGDAFLEARFERDRLEIDKLDLSVGEGRARVSGSLGLAGELPVSARVDLENVPFGRLMDKLTVPHAWVDFTASGRLEVKGGLAPFHLAGPASVDVRDFHVFTSGWDRPDPFHVLDFDQAHVELLADFNPERVHLARGRIRTPRGSDVDADATLHFDFEKGLDVDARPRLLDLADLRHIVGIPWDGKATGHGRVYGPYQQPRIDGEVTLHDFRFHKVDLGTVEARAKMRNFVLSFDEATAVLGRSRFTARGDLDLSGDEPRARASGRFEGARLSDLVEMIGEEHWIFDPLRGRAEARISGTASIDGPILAARSLVEARIEELVYLDRQLGEGRLVFRSEDGERILIEPLEIDGPCGPIAFSGKVELDEAIDFELDAPALVVEEWMKPNGVHLLARGTLAAKVRFFGPPEHARAEGTVVATDLALLGAELGGGTLDLKMDRTTLSLTGPIGEDLVFDGRLDAEGDMPFAVGLELTTSDLGHYFPEVDGLKGSLAAEMMATGTIARWEETRGDVWIPAFEAGKGEWSLSNEGPVALSFQGGLVELKGATVTGPAGTRLDVSGVLDGELDVSVDGAFDARLVELFTPWIEQTAGRFQLSATVSGPPGRPEVVGAAALDGGRFAVHGWPVNVRDARGRVEFSQNKVFLSDVEAVVNNGPVRLRGDVEMKDFVPHRLDLSALLDEVQMRWPETVPTAFSGELKLYGPLTGLVLAGDVDLVRLRYSEELDLEAFLRDLRRHRLDARSFEKREEWLRYDVKVHVLKGGGARIDNNLMKLSMSGDLAVVGTNVHMGLLGTLTAEEGGRAFFRDNELWISRGAVDFTERDRIAASVDVHAEGQVRDYKVWIHAFGPVEDPQVDLRSDPELDRVDVLALLTLGVTSRDRGTYGSAAGVGLASETLMNIAGLDKQLKKFVPKNTILRDFGFHISTQYSESSGMVEPTAQLESKFLTDSLRLRLSQPVISGKGRKAQLEYQFNEHMSAQGQWDNESSDSSLGDLGFDLKLRWELE